MGSLYSVYLHVVFSTKKRVKILTDDVRDTVFNLFRSVASKYEASVLECNGMEDHIHLLIKVKLNINISDLIKEMKRLSSYCVNRDNGYPYFYWQHHYAVFSVSETNCNKVINYIKNQQAHHKNQSFINELEWIARKCKESLDDDFYK